MAAWILVFLGGGLGSVFRYLLARHLNASNHENWFPYGTLIANVVSCFILGYLIQKQWNLQLSDNGKLFLATGFCGGFSTFSTFSFEIYLYLQKDHLWHGLGYIGISMLFGILALIAGIRMYQIFM